MNTQQRAISLSSVLMFLLLLSPALPAQEDPNRPNILLIMADDQGWGDTGYNGHPHLKTPNLDEMAASGLRFDRFYAAHPICSPTRASVLTGRHPNRMGTFTWGHTIRPREITIAEALKTVDYATGHFGKWHVGPVRAGSPVNPGASGFDQWLSAPNFYDNDPILSRNGKAVMVPGESSMVAAEAAISFMEEQVKQNTPFLSVVWFGSPHNPHRAKPELKDLYPEHLKNRDWMGEITGIDRAVGKLRRALRRMGVAENTLVWYTSDNGGLMKVSSGGRLTKGSIYEGGLRVPGIIEWPHEISSSRSTDLPAVTSDIYPTILDITGVELEHQLALDGISLRPLLEGKSMTERPQPIGFWLYPTDGHLTPSRKWLGQLLAAQKEGDWLGKRSRLRLDAGKIKKQYPTDIYPGHAAWLDWPWKLHRKEGKQGEKTFLELYNLERDPNEQKNLIDQEEERANRMKKDLEQWLHSVAQSLNGH